VSKFYVRSWPLDDIRIRSGGDGRTVDAYAAIFDTPARVADQDGQYLEVIHRAAFNKTLADNGTRFGVFYNHGLTIHGTPSSRFSMPLGVPLEVKADGKGLFTRTRYGHTELADQVLQDIRDGIIQAQSFTGQFIRSDPALRRGQLYRPSPDGSLRTVIRLESSLREYGPTPLPIYAGAEIVGVRAQLLGALLGPDALAAVTSHQQSTGYQPDSMSTSYEAAPDGPTETREAHSRRQGTLRDQIRRARIARGI